MRRVPVLLVALLAALVAPVHPAHAISLYLTPDTPTDLGGTTYFPWSIVRYDTPAYAPSLTLPTGVAIDALHHATTGDLLLSVEAPADLGAFTFQPEDVFRLSGGGIYGPFFCGAAAGVPPGSNVDAVVTDPAGFFVAISFDVTTTIGLDTFEPGDLPIFAFVGPGCGGWIFAGAFLLDASATLPPVPFGPNVTAADERDIRVITAFDVPADLGPPTFMTSDLVEWNGGAFALFEPLAGWPSSSHVNAMSFPADPGTVPTTMTITRITINGSTLELTWSGGCSAGDEDYGIYEGTMGTWNSHARVDCHDDFSDLVEQIGTTSGDRYYLVVPLNPNDEGSYGVDSSSVQRPVGTTTCVPTQVIACP